MNIENRKLPFLAFTYDENNYYIKLIFRFVKRTEYQFYYDKRIILSPQDPAQISYPRNNHDGLRFFNASSVAKMEDKNSLSEMEKQELIYLLIK